MTPACFDTLMTSIRRRWYRKDGLIVLLSLPGSAKYSDVRLVVPPAIMLPDKCLLWHGDSKLYEGPVESPELRKALTSVRVCLAVYVKPSRLGSADSAPKQCVGCPAGCLRGGRGECRRRLRPQC